MAILLNKSYMGLVAGTTVGLATNIEQALIGQGLATASTKANITPGSITYNGWKGTVVIGAGATQVTITSPYFDQNSKVLAYIAQPALDGTLTSINRVVAADRVAGAAGGSVTIYGNAAATAPVIVDWVMSEIPGLTVYP